LSEPTGAAAGASAAGLNPVEVLDREAKIVEALRTIYDPEIPVDIYELGLVYNLLVDPSGNVTVQMTLTAPSCPEAASIPPRVEAAVRTVPGVNDVKVELVWEPPWSPARMSEAAKLQLGFL
jgi:FeS assembly SUF system protein